MNGVYLLPNLHSQSENCRDIISNTTPCTSPHHARCLASGPETSRHQQLNPKSCDHPLLYDGFCSGTLYPAPDAGYTWSPGDVRFPGDRPPRHGANNVFSLIRDLA
jgi:hypothetical protein